MSTLDNLLTLVQDAIDAAPKDKAFGKAMETILARAHTAAYLAAAAERAGVKVDGGLFKGLSKAERADIKQAVGEQLKYLEKFVADMGDMSEAQVAARAAMYGGSIRATYGAARHPGLPFYPTEGSECLTNCRCSWQDDGDGSYTWVLSAKESCSTCEARAADNPYTVEAS